MIKDISNMFYFILQGYLQGYQIVWLYVYCYYLESSEICFNFRVFYIQRGVKRAKRCKLATSFELNISIFSNSLGYLRDIYNYLLTPLNCSLKDK